MKIFCQRLQAAFESDSAIAAYAPNVAVVSDRRLDRYDVAALAAERGAAIVIHNPTEEIDHAEHRYPGRDCDKLGCLITAVVVTSAGLPDNRQEAALMGTASRVGALEIIADVKRVLWNSGFLNLLPDSAGACYVWDMEFGTVADSLVETEKSRFLTAAMPVTAHRWRQYV